MYKALIVDDEPLVREYLMSNLSVIHNKWQAAACTSDGYKAVEKLKSETFDAVVTDICMPGMDGLELAKHIYDHCKGTYTVIISGHDEFDYARRAMRYDVTDYLLKPINDDEFHEVFERLTCLIEERKSKLSIPLDSGKTALSPDNVSEHFKNYLSAVTGDSAEEPETLADRATEYIYAHFCEPIALSNIAEELGVSPAYLSSVFHSVKGESYSKFILRLRMERATLLLKKCPNTKVYHIAEQIGYASSKHFIGVFKKYFGMTPNEYREKRL
jgi:YesN/AraC family two-component response regulator